MDPELYNAAQTGDVDLLRRRGDEAADLLSQKTPNKSSILHIAAEFNHLEFFKQAFNMGSPGLLNHANATGNTALHLAAREGSTEVVDFIINHAGKGKEVYSVDIEAGEVNKELLRMVNRDGDNALHLAAQYGHYQVAKLVLEADPEISNYENKAGQSACFMATVRNEITIVELLLGLNPSCSLQAGANNGMTALHAAVFTSNDIAEKIANARPELIRESDATGWTPLHYAAACDKRVGAVKFFLEKDPFAAYLLGKEGESALHIAAFHGCLHVMKVLVATHPDCWDVLNNKGQTALHTAVLGEKPDVVKYILGLPELKSIDCIADDDGNTPLHVAVLSKSKSMIQILCADKKRVELSLLFRTASVRHLKALDISVNEVEGYDDGPGAELKETMMGLRKRHERAINYQENKITGDDEVPLKDSTGKDARPNQEFLQVTATLVATVTFTAGFTMPGGYNQSGGPNEGMAVLAAKTAFQAFLMFDIIAFFIAILVVFLQFTRTVDKKTRKQFPRWLVLLQEYSQILISFAFVALGLAFACALYVVLLKTRLGLAAFIVSIYLSFFAFIVILGSSLVGY